MPTVKECVVVKLIKLSKESKSLLMVVIHHFALPNMRGLSQFALMCGCFRLPILLIDITMVTWTASHMS